MIKRSTLLALLAVTAVTARKHVHGPDHSTHVLAPKAVDISVKGDIIPDVQNADICSFYQDDSFYVLKFIIANGFNYNKTDTIDNREVEFNICNRLNGFNDSSHACYQTFACLKDVDGEYYPLSGHDFKSSIRPSVTYNRPNDTEKGGLSLQFADGNSTCEADSKYKKSLHLELLCDEDGDRDGVNDVHDLVFSSYNI